MKISDYAKAQGWLKRHASSENSTGEWEKYVALNTTPELDIAIKTINDKYGPGTVFPASEAPIPPMTDTQAVFEWEERNRKAGGGRMGFMAGKSAKIGAPITGETISKAEFNKIKKLLKDRPGIGIYPTQREGAYTIKVKVEKGGKIIQADLLYSKDNLNTMLEKWQSARNQLFPNELTDAKYLELRLSNPTLTQDQFADLLNEGEYLSKKGNKFTNPIVFKWDKRLKVHDLSPEIRGAEKRTIKEAEQIVKEKFGKDFKKIFKTDKEIRAKATQLINDKGKFKGNFPRGAGAEDFLWHSFNRAAKGGSKQITYDLSALDYELPMEDGKINWNKKINGTPAWKLVKFKDNDVGKTFSYNEKNGKHIIGNLKNQVNTAYNNTNKFNNSVKGYYEQAGISEKFKNAARDNFLIKELESKLGRSITKADDELVKNWLKERRPGFSLTQVHHPEGVAKNVYNTQNVVRAANLAERDLTKTYSSEVKTLGEAEAKKNYKKNLQIVSDEFGGIQTKFEGEKRYVGDAPTVQSIEDYITGKSNKKPMLSSGFAGAFEQLMDEPMMKALANSAQFKKFANFARGTTKYFGPIDLLIGFADYENELSKYKKADGTYMEGAKKAAAKQALQTMSIGLWRGGDKEKIARIKETFIASGGDGNVFDKAVAINENQNKISNAMDSAKKNYLKNKETEKEFGVPGGAEAIKFNLNMPTATQQMDSDVANIKRLATDHIDLTNQYVDVMGKDITVEQFKEPFSAIKQAGLDTAKKRWQENYKSIYDKPTGTLGTGDIGEKLTTHLFTTKAPEREEEKRLIEDMKAFDPKELYRYNKEFRNLTRDNPEANVELLMGEILSKPSIYGRYQDFEFKSTGGRTGSYFDGGIASLRRKK